MLVLTPAFLVLLYFNVKEWQQTLRPPTPGVPRLFLAFEWVPMRRLGNLMFLFASAVGIAAQNNMTMIIDRSSPLVDAFHIVELTVDDVNNALAAASVVSYYEQLASTYDATARDLLRAVGRTQRPSNVRICCYFQSWRYFHESADRVRQNFRFREPIAAAADAFIASKSSGRRNTTTRVGIHVRHSYASDAYKSGYIVAPLHYFRSAMRYFTDRYHHVEFVVCSDDVTWCRENLPAAVDATTDAEMKFSYSNSAEVDLAILARCDHVIMSVGTYSWWAAWLANGTTVYYADWPGPSTMLSSIVNKSDYFPPHWIAMR